MAEPGAKKKSVNDLLAQYNRIIYAIYGAEAAGKITKQESGQRWKEATKIYHRYVRNITRSDKYNKEYDRARANGVPNEGEYDNTKYSRSVYMGRRNNRR